jgi:hypothetical protein
MQKKKKVVKKDMSRNRRSNVVLEKVYDPRICPMCGNTLKIRIIQECVSTNDSFNGLTEKDVDFSHECSNKSNHERTLLCCTKCTFAK